MLAVGDADRPRASTDMGITRLLDLSNLVSSCQPGEAPGTLPTSLDCGGKFDSCGMVRTTGLVYGPNQDVVIKGRAVPDCTCHILHSLSDFLFLDPPFATLVPIFLFFFLNSSVLPNKQSTPSYFFPCQSWFCYSNLIFLIPLSRESWPSVVLQIRLLKYCWHCKFCLPEDA